MEPQLRSLAPKLRQNALCAVFIGGFALWITCAASIVRPVYDDAYTTMMWQSGGNIKEHMRDRPLLGACEQYLAERNVIWPVGLALHWIGWAGLGLITMRFWSLLFPSLASFRVAAALLVMAPLICDYQLVVLNSMGGLTSILLALAAVLLMVGAEEEKPRWQTIARGLASALLMSVGVLICEYAIPAVVAAIVALGMKFGVQGKCGRRERMLKACFLMVVLAASYAAYWLTADKTARDLARPEVVLADSEAWGAHLREVVKGIGGIWFASVGGFLKRTGSLAILDTLSVVSLAAGAAAALVTSLWSWSDPKELPCEKPAFPARPAYILAAAITVGMLPVLLMRRKFPLEFGNNIGEGRYWLPVLPFAACLTLYILLLITRRRYHWLVLPLCGLLAGYYTADQGLRAMQKRRLLESWGVTIEPLLDSTGITVAVFDTPESPRYVPEDELTQRVTKNWPTEKRSRFWAFPDLTRATWGISNIEWGCGPEQLEIKRNIRGLKREGPVARLLWIHVEPTGKIDVVSHDRRKPDGGSGEALAKKNNMSSVLGD